MEPLGVAVEAYLGVVAGAVGSSDPRLVDIQIERVEHHLVDGAVHVDGDRRGTGEGGAVEVGRELQDVLRRGDVGGEPVGIEVGHGRRRYRYRAGPVSGENESADEEREPQRLSRWFLLVVLVVVAIAIAGVVVYAKSEDAPPPPECFSEGEPGSTVPASCPTS